MTDSKISAALEQIQQLKRKHTRLVIGASRDKDGVVRGGRIVGPTDQELALAYQLAANAAPPTQEIKNPSTNRDQVRTTRGKSQNIEGRMMRIINSERKNEVLWWDSTDWAAELKCSGSAVRRTKAWTEYIPGLRKLAGLTPDQVDELLELLNKKGEKV